MVDDYALRTTLFNKWTALANRPGYGGFDFYLPLLAILAGALSIALIFATLPFILKVFKSWILGVISGLTLLWAISFYIFFSSNSLLLFQHLRYSLYAAAFLTLISLALRVRALELPSGIANTKVASRGI